MIDREHIERLRKNRDWLVVENFIRETVAKLDTITCIDFTDKEAAVIEGRARQLAAQKLEQILQPFVQFQERPDREQGADDKRRDAGL